jgi:hypothetical protein
MQQGGTIFVPPFLFQLIPHLSSIIKTKGISSGGFESTDDPLICDVGERRKPAKSSHSSNQHHRPLSTIIGGYFESMTGGRF